MAGKTPYEAFDNFLSPLQKAFSCVNKEAHLWPLGSNGYSPGQEHALVPDKGESVKLFGARDLRLTCLFYYRIEQAKGAHDPWKVTTTAYSHTLENASSQEIIAYHWHPGRGSVFDFPHLHIGVGIGASLGKVHNYHIPTGRVALEDVIRLAITEFEVKEQRPDWDEVLRENQASFEQSRTWSGFHQKEALED